MNDDVRDTQRAAIEASEPFDAIRVAVAVAELRGATRLAMEAQRQEWRGPVPLVLTDTEGPRGAGEFIRTKILDDAPADADVAWLERSDWWERVLNAAQQVGVQIT